MKKKEKRENKIRRSKGKEKYTESDHFYCSHTRRGRGLVVQALAMTEQLSALLACMRRRRQRVISTHLDTYGKCQVPRYVQLEVIGNG